SQEEQIDKITELLLTIAEEIGSMKSLQHVHKGIHKHEEA
ncbi:unnamed protein product, partial [marine sediment metagenome]